MRKYMVVIFILILLFISGCQVAKTGEAKKVKDTPPPTQEAAAQTPCEPFVTVSRNIDCGSKSVNLDISTSCLADDEIIVIVDRVPYGAEIVDGSGTPAPAYIVGNKLVWLFAKNPPQTTEDSILVSEPIPSGLSYGFSGTSDVDFRGKFSLVRADKEGLISGVSSCTS